MMPQRCRIICRDDVIGAETFCGLFFCAHPLAKPLGHTSEIFFQWLRTEDKAAERLRTDDVISKIVRDLRGNRGGKPS